MNILKLFVILILVTGVSTSATGADYIFGEPEGMTFVKIPDGTFEMGDHFDMGYEHERPVHTVSVGAFLMSKYEVTNAQYAEFLNAAMADGLIKVVDDMVYAAPNDLSEPYLLTAYPDIVTQISFTNGLFKVRNRSGLSMDDHPVVTITWYGAKAFCDYYGYRLPTEAEWEYAARGGFHAPYFTYPWGSNSTSPVTQLNFNRMNPLGLSSKPLTTPVDAYPAYGYGLCSMAGNVSEWCNDWWGSYYYRNSPLQDPQGPESGITRSIRGGNWAFGAVDCRVAGRGSRAPEWYCPHGGVGFRPAMDMPELIAHWTLDETEGCMIAGDIVGGYDAYIIGDPVWQPTGGKVDGAMLLDGVDDCAVTGPCPKLAGWPFSLVAWTKGGAPGQVVFAQMIVANWLSTDASNGTLMTELKSAGQEGCALNSEAVITDGDWHHIGIVWDGLNRTLSADGVVVAEDMQEDLSISEDGLYIGTGEMMGPGTFWFGLIDDIRIYSRALSPEEIADLVND